MIVVLAVVGSVTALGLQGTIDGAAVTSILGSIVGAVSVGHYVKTINGSVAGGAAAPLPPGTTQTTHVPPDGGHTL